MLKNGSCASHPAVGEVVMGDRRYSARILKQKKNDEVIFSAVNKLFKDLLVRESVKNSSDSQSDIFTKLIK